METAKGAVIYVSGPLVKASGLPNPKMYEVVKVGEDKLIGEIVRLSGDIAFIQVYESTSGLRPGDPVYSTGQPLSVSLGPGLLGTIFDGIQRPLSLLSKISGHFIRRGISVPALDQDVKWEFRPLISKGAKLTGGDVLGFVQETPIVEHKILAPPHMHGIVIDIVKDGKYTLKDPVARIERDGVRSDLFLYHLWPVRRARPYLERLDPTLPLITGQRILDTLFPMAKGGTGAIPGGFGTGKTVTLHQIAAWADAKVVIYIGCGERGNEMTEVLVRFPELKDPYSGRPLMERTVLIANTSNMPVAAREASIYTGVTIAEYYRDQGYDVVLVADSTSRWAEALREVSGRLEEMPAEEGFPPYLASRLAEFYERAGRVKALGTPERMGSVTIIGAVSPSGADFTEPVTMNTLRFIKVFWALDTKLAYSRHYPAINWVQSYSGYVEQVKHWWIENVDRQWYEKRSLAYEVLLREDALREIVRLLGPEALPDSEKLILDVARIIKEGFLQQNAFDEIDAYCSPLKQVKLLDLLLTFYKNANLALQKGVPLSRIRSLPVISSLMRARFEVSEKELEKLDVLKKEVEEAFKALLGKVVERVA
ncbi:MAG: V-type ATP synthase subunit A [Nitrososphaerota archaeon]